MSAKEYCDPLQWVKKLDLRLWEAITDNCGAPKFGTRGGLTFLCPESKEERDKLSAVIDSGGRKSNDALLSRLLPFTVVSADDWVKHNADGGVGSKLKIRFGSATKAGKEVKIGETTFRPSEFKFFSMNGENSAAIWYSIGDVPTKGAAYGLPSHDRSAQKPHRPGHGSVTGSGESGVPATIRMNLFTEILKIDSTRGDAALGTIISLLPYLNIKNKDEYNNALRLLDYDPIVSCFLILEPGGATNYVVSQETLNDWTYTPPTTASPVAEYIALLNEAAKEAPSATNIAKIREKLIASLETEDPLKLGVSVHAAYESAGGIKTCWQDQVRYCMHSELADIRSLACLDAPSAAERLRELVLHINTYWPNTGDYEKCCLFSALQTIPFGRMQVCALLNFINSTDFLYAPAARTLADKVHLPSIANPMHKNKIDTSAYAVLYLQRLSANQLQNGDSMSPALRQQLKAFRDAKGPAALMAELNNL